jgi:hypothetical protein
VEAGAVGETGVVVGPGAVLTVPVGAGQMPLPESDALGYSTFGSPLERVTVMLPLESVVYSVQLIMSTSAWFASNPVADEESAAVADEEDPTLVNTPTT